MRREAALCRPGKRPVTGAITGRLIRDWRADGHGRLAPVCGWSAWDRQAARATDSPGRVSIASAGLSGRDAVIRVYRRVLRRGRYGNFSSASSKTRERISVTASSRPLACSASRCSGCD